MSQGSSEKQNRVCVCVPVSVCVCAEIPFKELAHTIMEASKSKICRWDGRIKNQEELMLQFVSKNLPLAQERSVFCSIRSFN